MYAITYEEACNNLGEAMNKVVSDHSPVIITKRHHSPVVMISLYDYNSWRETECLTHFPANTKDLREASGEMKNHRNPVKRELIIE